MRVKFVLGSPLLRFIYEENVLDASDILLQYICMYVSHAVYMHRK